MKAAMIAASDPTDTAMSDAMFTEPPFNQPPILCEFYIKNVASRLAVTTAW